MNFDRGSSSRVPEFDLPDKVRELLARILRELIQPARQKLQEADRTLAAWLERDQAVLARVKATAESGEKHHRRYLRGAESRIKATAGNLERMRQTAQEYLHCQGRLGPPSSTSAVDHEVVSVTREGIDQAVAPVKAQFETIQQWKPPSYWPPSSGARWTIVLASFALLFVFYPLVLSWLVIVFASRLFWHRRAASEYDGFTAAIFRLQAALETAKSQAQRQCEEEVAAATALVPPAIEQHTAATNRTWSIFNRSVQDITQATEELAKELHDKESQLWEASSFASADWDSQAWESWAPDSSPEFAARIGTLALGAADLEERMPGLDLHFRLPALIPFAEGKCLLFNSTPRTSAAAAAAMQSVVIRVLANTPPGKARFTLIDPVGLGQNVADFMALGDYDEQLINGKAWTEISHIEQQLTEITEHMETVIQKYLRTDFASIHQYNSQAEEVAEPFRFLVIFDFPVSFSESAARRLVSIVRNGPRCGVFTFVVRDTSKQLPFGFNLNDLDQAASAITWDEGKAGTVSAAWMDGDFANVPMTPDRLDGHRDLVNTIIAQSGETALAAMNVEVPFDRLLDSRQADGLWSQSTAENLRVPVGPSGARKLQYLTLGEGLAHHCLIVGRTGSGKTNLMRVIITGLALTHSPEELQLYLIDFKGGVGFKPYAAQRLPHAAVIAIESEREFGISVLQGLDRELQRRFNLFRAAGVDNLRDYRKGQADRGVAHGMPRVLLLVDEFQELFSRDDSIATQARAIFDRMVRQGRSFGLHVLLGTQSLAGSAHLPPSTMGQMAVRIALPCSDADSRMILAQDNAAARSLSRPGEAIYNPAAGLVEGNNPFQTARLRDEELQGYLEILSGLAQKCGSRSHPIIFEGNEPADLGECEPLHSLIDADSWPDPLTAPVAWLGEPVAMLPPVGAVFRKQSGKHLLIVCREEAEGIGALYASWVSLLCQHRPTTARFYVLDASTVDSPWASFTSVVRSAFVHEVEVLDRGNTPLVLGSLATMVERRLECPGHAGETVFLLILGLHRVRDLRPTIDSYYTPAGAEPAPADLLAQVLRDGPEVGAHVVAWCDTVTNARRSLDRAFGEFGMRLAGPMSIEESSLLLDCGDASRLERPHRLLFCDDERPGLVQKLRPYSLPSVEWLESVAARQRLRQHG